MDRVDQAQEAMADLASPTTFGCTVIGPECEGGKSRDLLSLFAEGALSGVRVGRFHDCSKIAAQCGGDLVGIAAYRLRDGRLDVEELAVEQPCRCEASEIVSTLLRALESACLAGGGHRVVLSAEAAGSVANAVGEGYRATGPTGRTTLEKTLL